MTAETVAVAMPGIVSTALSGCSTGLQTISKPYHNVPRVASRHGRPLSLSFKSWKAQDGAGLQRKLMPA